MEREYQDVYLSCPGLLLCVCVCVYTCKFTCISMRPCVCGQSRWIMALHGFFACWRYIVDIRGDCRRSEGVGGVWKRCVYPKQTGQIRSEWRERSWKPSWADPFLRLSHIPPNPSLPSFSPFSLSPRFTSKHLFPASTHLFTLHPRTATCCIHYSLFFKQYPHVWCFLTSFFSFCVVSPLLFLTLLPVLHLPSPPPPPRLSRTSVKWGQPVACNAMSLLCFSLALWPRSLILASLNWPIAFYVFPWVMS